MHEAGACVVGHVLAGEQRNGEVVALTGKRMGTGHPGENLGGHILDFFVRGDARLLEDLVCELVREN